MKKRITKLWTRVIVLSLFLSGFASSAHAQSNVTISQLTGNMIPARTSQNETGWAAGAFSLWMHEQLSLTMVTSDYADVNQETGLLNQHANNFYPAEDGKSILLVCGVPYNGYMMITLPNGYNFTEYTIVAQNNISGSIGAAGHALSIGHSATYYFGETDANFAYTSAVGTATLKSMGTSAHDTEYTITRTDANMGNKLYFKLANSTGSQRGAQEYQAITLKYIELKFTSESDFNPEIENVSAAGVTYLELPFNTGKTDVGSITMQEKNGVSRHSYTYNNVSNMESNLLIYEENSTLDNQTGFDGTVGKIAIDKGNGTISTVGDYLKLAGGTGTTYYVETPVSGKLSDGTEIPMNYRITGATINYTKNAGGSSTVTHNYITTGSGTSLLYLNDELKFTSTPVEWKYENNHWSCNGKYLVLTPIDYGTGTLSTTTDVNSATTFSLYDSALRFRQNNRQYWRYIVNNNGTAEVVTDYTTSAAVRTQETETITGSVSDDYTLVIYDKEGKEKERITVSGADSYTWPNTITDCLNNDAIKFGVIGTGLVNVQLTLQALDPYLDRMEVVCYAKFTNQTIRLSNPFSASDFAVGGKEFDFQLPKGTLQYSIAFENLYSQYEDYTYVDATSDKHGRPSFVMSEYYQEQAEDYNLYNHKAVVANYDYTKKIVVDELGTQKFKFNNVEDLHGGSGGVLIEYPFTLAKYKAAGGSFVNYKNKPVPEEATPDRINAYVFTTDETRYNIAPTSATQHRTYAYYDIVINLTTATYEPVATLTKIYDSSFYLDEDGNEKTSPFYGLTITATDAHGESGYVLGSMIKTAVDNALAAENAKLPEGADPITLKNVLYEDLSSLQGVIEMETEPMSAFQQLLAPNAIIFLPANNVYALNNCATLKTTSTDTRLFDASQDIILVDKQPFYSPYTIQVGAEHFAQYTRLQSASKYGQVQWASLILPFSLKLNNGVYTDENGGSAMTFYQMKATNAISKESYETGMDGTAYFEKLEAASTEANVPYSLHVDASPADKTQTFIIKEKAASFDNTVLATPEEVLHTGYVSAGTYEGKDVTFTHKGTYSGLKFNKTQTPAFYIANNVLNGSADLGRTYVKMFPFRTLYTYPGESLSKTFSIFIGENSATGIDEVSTNRIAGVTTGHGFIAITADEAATYNVVSLSGQNVDRVSLQAGESRTLSVPAGIYLVNNMKVLVK